MSNFLRKQKKTAGIIKVNVSFKFLLRCILKEILELSIFFIDLKNIALSIKTKTSMYRKITIETKNK